MADDARTKPSDSGDSEEKPRSRVRRFPIRQFSKLLDDFLVEHPEVALTETVADLKTAIDQALLKAYKE